MRLKWSTWGKYPGHHGRPKRQTKWLLETVLCWTQWTKGS